MAINQELKDDFKDMGREMFDDMLAPGEKYIEPAVYDEIDGSLLTSEVVHDVTSIIDLIEDAITEEELMIGAIRVTLLQEDLPVVPKQGDIVVDEKGVRYNTESWSEDPAHVVWQAILKKE